MRLNSYLVRKEIEKKGHGERLKNENVNMFDEISLIFNSERCKNV